MSVVIEVHAPEGFVETFRFEVVPRVGESVFFAYNTGLSEFNVQSVAHFPSTHEFQAAIHVVPISR